MKVLYSGNQMVFTTTWGRSAQPRREDLLNYTLGPRLAIAEASLGKYDYMRIYSECEVVLYNWRGEQECVFSGHRT